MRRAQRSTALGFGLCLAWFAGACARPAPFVWAQDLPAEQPPRPGQLISAGDIVDVRVFGQEPLSARGNVRSDGMFTLPLLGLVPIAGQRPEDVASKLEERFKPYVNAPEVTVVIVQSQVSVTVVGEVRQPGVLPLESPATLLHAIARAGGVTEYADESGIFVLRAKSGTIQRIRFTYEDLIHGKPRQADFFLKSGDVVVVE